MKIKRFTTRGCFLSVRSASFVWFEIIKNTKILTKNQPTNWRIQSGSGEILLILGVFDDFKTRQNWQNER